MATISGRKGGSSNPRTPVESPDSLQSIATAKILLALGEGEFAGGITAKDIFLDGTPVESVDGTINFPGVIWEVRTGTQPQDYIPGVPAVENEITINTPLKAIQSWTRAISNTQLSAVRVRIGVPALQQQLDNGDVVGFRVEYKIELSVDGGGYSTILNGAFDGKTTSLYERSHRIELPKANTGWQIRVSRSTPDSTSNRIASATNIEAYSEIIDAKLRYPNTALLFVTFDAKQFNSIPQISVKARGRVIRVPTTYDPVSRTYSGAWDGSFKWAYSNNPAWVFYDLLLNERFGLGDRISAAQVDKWELYRIAQYCDQPVPDGLGGSGTEPRFLCDVYIQSQNEAFTVLRDLASMFRGMTYWSSNQVVAIADMPAANDERNYIYTRSNVIAGKFTYSSGSERDRYSTAMVSWSNPDNHYADDVEAVVEQDLVRRYNVRQTEITAIGCTRRTEANRRGRWALLTNAKDRLITFNTGLDGFIPQPGRIIYVADQYLSGRIMGGRISSVSGRVVTLDRGPDAVAGDRLLVNLPSGKSEARTIQAVTGKKVTVSAPWSVSPEPEAVWSIDAQDVAVQQYRVTSVKDNDDNTFTVSGVFHNPDKFAAIDSGTRLDERPISAIPPGVQAPPADVSIDSYSRVFQGLSVETMRVSWPAAENAIAYECQWRKDNGDWVNAPRVSTLGFEIDGIYSGRYTARIRAVNASDISSVWATSSEATLTGKIGQPPVPINLRTLSVNWGIQIDWNFPDGAEDTLMTEIQYSTSASGESAMLLADIPYPARTYLQMGLKAGQEFWYRARLIDRIGNQSEWTGLVAGQASVDVSDITEQILEEIKESDVFKDLIENAVDSSEKIAELAGAIKDNADGLAAAVGSNKQTAEAIIHNAMAIADVVTRQTAQNGANSAKFEQLRGVIATETEARVTDVKRLEAKTDQNAAGITEVREAISDEKEARATAVNQLTAATKVASDKADAAAEVGAENAASITELDQAVTTLDSSMASRLSELAAQTERGAAGAQNNAIAVINNVLAQVNIRTTMSVQYGDNKAGIERVDNVMTDASKAVAESLKTLDASAGGGSANSTDFAQVMADYSQVSATKINSLTVTVDGQQAVISDNSKIIADINGNLSASRTIKLAVDANGHSYMAGIGIGISNESGITQSQIIALADRFAIMSQVGGTVSIPFVINNGQTFINETFINYASITLAKIGQWRSANYVPGSTGTRMDADGSFEVNGSAPGGGRLVINGPRISAIDANGVEQARFGYLK